MIGKIIHRLPHADTAVPEGLKAHIKTVVPLLSLPAFDNTYIFVDSEPSFTPSLYYFGPIGGDKGQIVYRAWVVGFDVATGALRGPGSGFVLLHWRIEVTGEKSGTWPDEIESLVEGYKADAVVAPPHVALALMLAKPELRVTTVQRWVESYWPEL